MTHVLEPAPQGTLRLEQDGWVHEMNFHPVTLGSGRNAKDAPIANAKPRTAPKYLTVFIMDLF